MNSFNDGFEHHFELIQSLFYKAFGVEVFEWGETLNQRFKI